MYRQRMTQLLLVLLLVGLIVTGCTPTAVAPETGASTEQVVSLTPQQVTEEFYSWYLGYVSDRSDGSFTNPLAEGLHREGQYLTGDFVARIDETIAGFEQGGFDPILLAQDIPVRIEVQEPSIDGASAAAVVLRYWGGNPDPSPMVIHLVHANGRWLIDNVTHFETPAAMPPATPETPADVVSAFYDWYLAYIGEPGSDNFRNPMVDKAYHDAPYLTESFVGHIDELLESFDGAGYDPFLCAQDIPLEMTPVMSLARTGKTSVVVRSSFINHMVTVDLRPEGESWLISDIVCAFDPAGTATAFYTWYLGYHVDPITGEFRNPMVDKAYLGHPLLAESWVETVEEAVAGFDQGGFDPFLMAQDVPQDFSVDPGLVEGTAVVHLEFGSDCAKHLLVTMDETGRKIAAIAEDEERPSMAPEEGSSASQSVYVNDEFGFSFSYPAAWVLQEMALGGPGMPEDWPVTAAWSLMPPDVAEQLAGQSSPPDPNAPVIVAPFSIEVVAGDKEALARVYGELDGGTAVPGVEADFVLQRDPGYSHVIFAHPLHGDTWLVFTDWVTQFPGREGQGQAASSVWPMLLGGVQFHKAAAD